MSDLFNYNNMHANLSESTYNDRANNFPSNSHKNKEQIYDFCMDSVNRHRSGEVSFTKGGINLPNDGIVYLQSDPTIKTTVTPKTYQTPQMNGGYEAVQYNHKTSRMAYERKLI